MIIGSDSEDHQNAAGAYMAGRTTFYLSSAHKLEMCMTDQHMNAIFIHGNKSGVSSKNSHSDQ